MLTMREIDYSRFFLESSGLGCCMMVCGWTTWCGVGGVGMSMVIIKSASSATITHYNSTCTHQTSLSTSSTPAKRKANVSNRCMQASLSTAATPVEWKRFYYPSGRTLCVGHAPVQGAQDTILVLPLYRAPAAG